MFVITGFPATPSPLATDIPVPFVIVRPVNVSAAVWVNSPFVLYAAREFNVESKLTLVLVLPASSTAVIPPPIKLITLLCVSETPSSCTVA